MNTTKNNAVAFLWHALFLALAKNFMDMDVILPAMVVDAGGNSFHVGLLTAIMTGGVQLSLLIFTPFLSGQVFKKQYLLTGINVRILALLGMAALFFFAPLPGNGSMVWMILLLIAIFSIGGAFANIGYIDILGKSIASDNRKTFFSVRHVFSNTGVLISAYLARLVLAKSAYPENYRLLFFYAAILLAIASLGFWKLREIKTEPFSIRGTPDFLRHIKKELKQNKKLKNYIILSNMQGVMLALLPFLVLYSKTVFHAAGENIGNYLMLKVIGGVTAGMLIYYFSKRVRYQYLLYSASGIAVLIPLLILTVPVQAIFPGFFLLGGIALVFHLVSMDGILLELSTPENRVLYAGLSGAAKLLPGVFSLFAGWIIQISGLHSLFILFVLILGMSLFFIYKLACQK